MIIDGLMHHAAREVPKAFPGIGVVAVSSVMSLPWQQLGYIAGFGLIVLQAAYSIWKWHREARVKPTPAPTVPPSRDA